MLSTRSSSRFVSIRFLRRKFTLVELEIRKKFKKNLVGELESLRKPEKIDEVDLLFFCLMREIEEDNRKDKMIRRRRRRKR